MPTYLYKDLETGEIYELVQSMRDEAYTAHPETGAAVKRMPARPAIAFKGSGFYANDSRPREGKAGAAQGGAAKSPTGKGSTEKSAEKGAAGAAPARASGGGGE